MVHESDVESRLARVAGRAVMAERMGDPGAAHDARMEIERLTLVLDRIQCGPRQGLEASPITRTITADLDNPDEWDILKGHPDHG